MTRFVLFCAVLNLLLLLARRVPSVREFMVDALVEEGRSLEEARLRWAWGSVQHGLVAVFCCVAVLL